MSNIFVNALIVKYMCVCTHVCMFVCLFDCFVFVCVHVMYAGQYI